MAKFRYTKNDEGKYEWVELEEISTSKPRPMNAQGEDLTIDGYINKHGGIFSHADNKVHTSKNSYLEGLRKNDCIIKDW